MEGVYEAEEWLARGGASDCLGRFDPLADRIGDKWEGMNGYEWVWMDYEFLWTIMFIINALT